MTKLQQKAVELVLVRQGMKARDLTIHLGIEFPEVANDAIIQEIIDLVAHGELIEIEFDLPSAKYGIKISRSFLVPKGTAININKHA